MESKHLQLTTANENSSNVSRGCGKKLNDKLTGDNIQTDSETRTKSQVNVSSLSTSFNKGRTHHTGASICSINKSQEHRDLPNFCAVTTEPETDKEVPTVPKVSEDEKLCVDEYSCCCCSCLKTIPLPLVCQPTQIRHLALSNSYSVDELKQNDSRTGRSDAIQLLYEYGTGLNKYSDYKLALKTAAESGQLEKLEILMDHNEFVPNWHFAWYDALLSALKFGKVDCAKLLLNRGTHINIHTAAKLTVENKRSESFQFLASQYKIDVNKDNLLHLAVENDMEDMVNIMINMGADVNKVDCDRTTPLMKACNKGLDIVKLLLAKGAQTNLQNAMGWTALHKATYQANVDLIQLLVESGADLEVQSHQNETAYLLAAKQGNMKLIEFFQNNGANKFAVDSSGYNALMCAFENPYSTITPSALSLLADSEAQINHQSDKGFTALMLVASAGNETLMKTLLDLGADVNINTSNSLKSAGKEDTALSILLEKSNNFYSTEDLACIEELIRYGAVNSLPSRCNDVLLKMIRLDYRKMIHLLLTNGMAPTMVKSYTSNILYRYDRIVQLPMLTPTSETSPLTLALELGNTVVVQYLAGNWALCPCDVAVLSKSRDNLITLGMSERYVEFVDKLFSRPGSLLQLSFVAVSHALGGVPGREERVNSLPLPQSMKDKLMFRKEVVQMVFTEDVRSEIEYNLDDDNSDDDFIDYGTYGY